MENAIIFLYTLRCKLWCLRGTTGPFPPVWLLRRWPPTTAGQGRHFAAVDNLRQAVWLESGSKCSQMGHLTVPKSLLCWANTTAMNVLIDGLGPKWFWVCFLKKLAVLVSLLLKKMKVRFHMTSELGQSQMPLKSCPSSMLNRTGWERSNVFYLARPCQCHVF